MDSVTPKKKAIEVLCSRLRKILIDETDSVPSEIPLSVFSAELGMQEAVCSDLVKKGKSFKEIAALLHRDYKTVWSANFNAKVKHGR
ncbi:MAG: hypothetical protein O2779_00295 [Nanoarchaeota archaeon]|nr:hypothetical protein [Nanoarchaeota archaeon]